MKGHIKLGAPGDLRPYLLIEPRNYRAQTANPMAARVSTGSQYGDLQAWSTFLMADWQAGVGKQQAEAGGYLFGEIESRVPNQLILPAALGLAQIIFGTTSLGEAVAYMPADVASYTSEEIGGTGNPARISVPIFLYSGGEANFRARVEGVAIYGYIPDGVEVTAALYSDNSGAPNASLAAGTLTATNYRPGYHWYYIPLTAAYETSAASGLIAHWVIYPSANNTIQLIQGGASPLAGRNNYEYNDSTWSIHTGCPIYIYRRPSLAQGITGIKHAGVRSFAIDTATGRTSTFTSHQSVSTGNLSGRPQGFRYDLTDNAFYRQSSLASTASFNSISPDALGGGVLFDGTIYIPQGATYSTWTLADDSSGQSAEDAHLFCSWAGYLWRAYNNQLWYSVDGSTWTAITNSVGPSDYRIRGMAGFGQYLYVATDEALYYVAPGDIAVGVYPWSTIDERNGRGMVVHQDALYIPVAGRILRYAEDGSMQDIWINRDDDFNNQRLGEIAALSGLSNWLVAGVNGTTISEPASVWAYTQQGWHHMATLPPGFEIRSLYYDRGHSRLWIASDDWAIFYIHAPDWALNPYNDTNSTFMPHGWLETGRIYGGLRELLKDWEGVRLFGEFIVGDTDAVVYYRDTVNNAWTALGTVTGDGQELRWSDYDERPNGRWLRLGLLLRTDDPTETPKIEAVATKLLPMVTDRRSWNLAILVSDDQEMIDGDVNTYSSDEMIAHLRSLVEQVPPFIFEDVNGAQYEVKATGSAENLLEYAWLDASQRVKVIWAFEMAVEQVTTGTYAGE